MMSNQVPQAPAWQAVAYMDRAKFDALRRMPERGGVLTTITSHRAFPEDVALYAAPPSSLLEQAVKALEMAQTGLQWYRDMYPEDTDGSDDEADEEIDAALAALREALKGQQ